MLKLVSEEICVCFNKAIVQSMFKHVASRNGSLVLTLFWTGKFAPPAGFFNIAQKPLGLGS